MPRQSVIVGQTGKERCVACNRLTARRFVCEEPGITKYIYNRGGESVSYSKPLPDVFCTRRCAKEWSPKGTKITEASNVGSGGKS